jgi:small GTP-binding protein
MAGESLAAIKKIVLLGDSAVGKTSLIRRYVFDQFEDSYIATIGSKVTMKKVKIYRGEKNTDLTLMIWDLIGREGYHALHSRTFVGTHGALLVADMTRKETLYSLERYWIPFLLKVVENVPMVFVCNKSDLENQFEFTPEDLTNVASKHNIGLEKILPSWLKPSYSTSAKTGNNVEKAFESLCFLMLESKRLTDPVRELYEGLMATDVRRASDKTSPIGALDAIIVDFCEGSPDSRMAMMVLRQEIARAGIDIKNPTKKGIENVVEYIADAESEYQDVNTVESNLKRRMKLISEIKE